MPRIFLLSPAHCGGLRARMVMREGARFDLARRLREPGGAPLGDVMAFLSGLYFRGKLAYARAFAAPPGSDCPGALVITPAAGLVAADTTVTVGELKAFARVDIDAANPRYHQPLTASARALAVKIGDGCDVVLLGSIASVKYTAVLSAVFGQRLKFPGAFVGRGDMSRGGLLLRAVAAGRELDYVALGDVPRRGPRPPKLEPMRRAPSAARR